MNTIRTDIKESSGSQYKFVSPYTFELGAYFQERRREVWDLIELKRHADPHGNYGIQTDRRLSERQTNTPY